MIKVLEPGTYTTVQDVGRMGYQNIGVPESGAVDKFSLRVANLLIGNDENYPALEVTIFGPKLKFEEDTIIAITGGNLKPLVDGVDIDNWTAIKISKGSELSFSGPESGLRSYIAFSGGISAESIDCVMGSYSTYVPGEFGGLSGKPLKSGDVLNINYQDAVDYDNVKSKKINNPPIFNAESTIRILLGPNNQEFSDESIDVLTQNTYSIAMDSDSVGIRLEGEPLLHKSNSNNVISEGTTFGSIQIPSNGLPIILMSNRGTSGGYLKIATVISADHSKLAQLMPGNKVKFSLITYQNAVQEYRIQENILDSLRDEKSDTIPSKIMASDSLVSIADESGNILSDKLDSQTVVARVTSGDDVEEIKIDISN